MSRGAHIVAVAARTPVGLTAEGTAAAVRAGVSRIREHPFMVDAAGEPLKCGLDSGLDAELFGAERILALTRHALAELAAKLAAQRPYPSPVRLLLALPEPRPGFSVEDANRIARELASAPPPTLARLRVELTETGHAGALDGLERAVRAIEQRGEDLCIVGGADSYLEADTLDWLDAEKRLARDGIRSGFPPGEGAAMVAVASAVGRLTLGLPSLAQVRAVACAEEKRDPKCDEGLMGEGMTEALRGALASLRRPGESVADIYLDINGERSRTEDWGFAMMRTATAFRDGTDYRSAISQCGELGAASAALACVLAVQAWRRRYSHGPIALACGSSWTGLRGAAILEGGTA
jgi:3-oxoacyl-[acyl-carrier-protein] synthase I